MKLFRRLLFGVRFGLLTPFALAWGCGQSPTTPEALSVAVEAVRLRTEDELRAWPVGPTIGGGQAIVVKGTALVGCGAVTAEASRKGEAVVVSVTATGDDRPCPANRSGWQPYVARVTGLLPGTYNVQATTIGHRGRAEFTATILAD